MALVLEKLGLKRSTYYYNLSHPRQDNYADVRPLVKEAFSRTPLGFKYSTKGAITVSVADVSVPDKKKEIQLL